MRGTTLDKWLGPRDADKLDPETMAYRAQPAIHKKNQCKGCAFERQGSDVCKAAGARAVAGGLPDCDAGFIYVLPPDPRQVDLVEEMKP